MFLRGKCRLWKKEKSKLQEWPLPSCSKHKLGEALSLLPPLWGTLLSSTQAAVGGLLQFLSLGDIQWATVQFPGNDSSYLNHIQVGDTLYHHWHGSWIEKKRDFSRAELSLNLEHSVWGCPNLRHSGWKCTELLAGCSCSTSFVECVVFRGKF